MSTYTRPTHATRARTRQPRDREGRFGRMPAAESDTRLAPHSDPEPGTVDWADAGLPPPGPDPTRTEQQAIDRAEIDRDCPGGDWADDFDADAYGRFEDAELDRLLGPY